MLKYIFFNAHTLTQHEIVVGDMLKRNDIMFRPKTLLGDSQSRQPYLMDSASIVWGHLLQNTRG